MSKSNEFRPEGQLHRGRSLAAFAAVVVVAVGAAMLQPPVQASAPLRADRPGPHDPPPAVAQAGTSPGSYQLRCWQYGRLLFDEGPVTLSPETRQGARLVAFDRHGAAVIVTDTGATTCMARPSRNATPSLALPR